MLHERPPYQEQPPRLRDTVTRERSAIERLHAAVDTLPPRAREAAIVVMSVFLLSSKAVAQETSTTHAKEDETSTESQELHETMSAEDRESFLSILAELRAAGVVVSIALDSTSGGPQGEYFASTHESRGQWQVLYDTIQNPIIAGLHGVAIAANPLRYAEGVGLPQLILPPELRNQDQQIAIPPYQTAIEIDQQGVPQFVVHNWITGEQIFTQVLSVRPSDLLKQDALYALENIGIAAAEAMKKDFSLTQQRFFALQQEHASVVSRAAAVELQGPSEGVAAIESLVDGHSLTVHFVPSGIPSDTYFYQGMKIDAGFINRTERKGIGIRGMIDNIVINTTIQDDDSRFLSASQKPGVEIYTDRYGNLISVARSPFAGRSSGILETVIVNPPTPFQNEEGSETALVPLSIDLTQLGYGEIREYFSQKEERPIATTGSQREYTIYTTLDDEDATDVIDASRLPLGAGVERAEQLFGATPGDRVRQVMIADSRLPNAQFEPRNSHAIVMQDALLADPGFDISTVAFHETMHAIDFQLAVSNSPEFVALYTSLQPDFFTQLDERQWYESTKGGHSAEASFELYASLINSFQRPDWQKKVDRMSSEFLRQYRQCADITLHILEQRTATTSTVDAISAGAPILQQLRERIAGIDSALAQGNREQK